MTTYKEVIRFLKNDDTDLQAYRDNCLQGRYVCNEFSLELRRRALIAGLDCRLIDIDFGSLHDTHGIVCFDTTDKGRIFIDPTGKEQPDGERTVAKMKIKIGKPYEGVLLFPRFNLFSLLFKVTVGSGTVVQNIFVEGQIYDDPNRQIWFKKGENETALSKKEKDSATKDWTKKWNKIWR